MTMRGDDPMNTVLSMIISWGMNLIRLPADPLRNVEPYRCSIDSLWISGH